MAENSVGYSRAGDAFHYRWAARRALRLIYPNAELSLLVVEGTKDDDKAGEYVIDISEYYGDHDAPTKIVYYQLKHTTVQANKPFILSDLKDTFVGFGKKFTEWHGKNEIRTKGIRFSIVTNRPFEAAVKQKLADVASGTCADRKFVNTLSKYTKLKGADLALFCSILKIEDAELDYNLQKKELRVDLARLVAGTVENAQLTSLTTLISDKVLPDSDGFIYKENVLQSFGIHSESELYPAKPIWEPSGPIVERSVYEGLYKKILDSSNPIIIHAPGGVGKSVFTQYLINNVAEGSEVVAYDCFGAGSYRNRSRSRHRHRDALVEIANELAAKGLCDPLLFQNGTQEAEIIRSFIKRVGSAVASLREAYKDGILLLLVDAADNAEMAAKEMNDICFAAELLREKLPDGCKLVYLCRPERMELLKPESYIVKLPLSSFSPEETLANLQIYFPYATAAEAEEFHRLTTANPRVQANALAVRLPDVATLLTILGPSVVTVEAQMQLQLEKALGRLKDNLPAQYHQHLNSICIGLASLSPNIPIHILAKTAGVDIFTIKSFVADIGRSLWLYDDSVQFRDEPSETWFRQNFAAKKEDLENFIIALEPLANHSAYAAEVLPQLYLQAEQYDKLITLALSDIYLPADNPIDQRNIRVYRLQFALKAALKVNNLKDACKLALRAGEETAGNERQANLLKRNIDLLVQLQSKEKIQQMAMRRELGGAWEGSENIYSASLLSQIDEFQGEARSFLRSAENWLRIYFETPKDANARGEALSAADILEMAYAHLNLNGVVACTDFLLGLKPKPAASKILRALVDRLIDGGQFDIIDEILQRCRIEPLFLLEANNALCTVGRFCQKEDIGVLLKEFSEKLKEPSSYVEDVHDNPDMSIIALAEAAIHYSLAADQIAKLVDDHLPATAGHTITQSYHRNVSAYYFRSLALRQYVNSSDQISFDNFLPEKFKVEELSYNENRELADYKEILSAVLPWFIGRVEIIANSGRFDPARINELAEISKKAGSRYRGGDDPIPAQLCTAWLGILQQATAAPPEALRTFYDGRLKESKVVSTLEWITTVRWAHRLEHLAFLRDELEKYTYERIRTNTEGYTDDLTSDYINLARAAYFTSPDNAIVYFDNAVEIASKFGDELLRRWEAVAALADRTSKSDTDQQEMAYRFTWIAELVGKEVREKHWSRGEAIEIAIALSPTGGIAALSRWRDREIGQFHWLVNAMLRKLVSSHKISSLLGWSFTPFCSAESLPSLVKNFVQSEFIEVHYKNIILESAVKRLRCEISENGYWYTLQALCQTYRLKSTALEQTLTDLPAQQQKDKEPNIDRDFMPDLDWDEIFGGLDILTPDGITAVNDGIKQAASEQQFHRGRHILMNATLARITDIDLIKFFEALLQCDWLEYYDAASFFENLPASRSARPAIVKKLPEIIEAIGKRFPLDLISEYGFNRLMEVLPGPADKSKWLKRGIFKGMINYQEFANAENLYDFVRLTANDLSPADSAEALAFALDRFEIHIDRNLGDGPWRTPLKTTGNAIDGLAGFLWSALGSPRSETRWRAAHTLKELSLHGEKAIFDVVFAYSGLTGIGAYGCERYPFYALHARQYLLIACARISLDNPMFLKDYAKQLAAFALYDDHLINQRLAADAALRIANAIPGLFIVAEIKALRSVGRSPFPYVEEEADDFSDNEPEAREDEENAKGFYFGYDFSRYWLGDIGDEFGITQTEMVRRTATIIMDEWNLHADRYDADPRVELWNRHRDYRTHYSHGSYPRDHNYSFYLSYHAMMVAGARLLKEQPPSTEKGVSHGQHLEDWISRHLLTRPDGYWLADWKDALPLKRPTWGNQDFKDWQADIKSEDMVRNFVFSQNKKTWLTVTGAWGEEFNSRRETYSVRSALVSPETADALMRALDTCADEHNFKLPDYNERDMEIQHGPFGLKGWIRDRSLSTGLDEYDPFAKDLPFSDLRVGEEFEQRLNIVLAKNKKGYIREASGEVVISVWQWASAEEDPNTEPEQKGSRMNCTLDSLQDLCKALGKEVIIEVRVDRNMNYSYRSSREDERQPAIHKLFILSGNGELRDSERSYRIREITG
ncbi:MAG: hypothetical protein EOO15_00840 [Chitinophagaceae bacterium]|nr:MAG: hypothetical protein EOO15_00840 [Chitinophagaceae bacterium]